MTIPKIVQSHELKLFRFKKGKTKMEKRKIEDCTDEDFDRILEKLVSEMSAGQILSYGEVNSFFREELNNEILTRFENGE